MNEKDYDIFKNQAIEELKKGIKESLLKEFVENYDYSHGQMILINKIIEHVDAEIALYDYNDYCKNVIQITEDLLENKIEYDKLFISKEEYSEIAQKNKGDESKIGEELERQLEKKLNDNLKFELGTGTFKELVRHKVKDKFSLAEAGINKGIENFLKKSK